MSDDEDSETQSTQTRWRYTNDILAFILVTAFIAYIFARTVIVPILLGPIELPALNAFLLTVFGTGFGVALAWAFGPEAVKAWSNRTGNDEK